MAQQAGEIVISIQDYELVADVATASVRWSKSARDEIAAVVDAIEGLVDPAVVERMTGLLKAYDGMVETPLWMQKNPYPSYEPRWES